GALRRRRPDARVRPRLRAARPAGLQVGRRRLTEGSVVYRCQTEPPLHGAAVIDTASTSQPPLWPSVGALLVSGWAGGIGASMLSAPLLGAGRFGSAFGPSALAATSLLPTVAVHSSRRCCCRGSCGRSASSSSVSARPSPSRS